VADRYEIVCSRCGKKDWVSFKPRSNAPVLCRNCYNETHGGSGAAAPVQDSQQADSSSWANKDDLMARMSAFRGLAELAAGANWTPDEKMKWVFSHLGMAVDYVKTGNISRLNDMQLTPQAAAGQ